MRRETIAAGVAAVGIGAALMAINANDHAQTPSTDTADVVATLAVFGGAAIWLALRWTDLSKPRIQLLRAIVAGLAIGALVIGLGSVIYDPWAD